MTVWGVGCTKKAYICHIVLRKSANKWLISSFWWYQLQWAVQEALAHLKTRMLILFINQHWEQCSRNIYWMTLIGFLVAAQGFMLYWINSYCTALDCILESNMVISMKGQIVFWDKTSFHINAKKKPFSFHQKTRLGECLPKIIFYNLSLMRPLRQLVPQSPCGARQSWSYPSAPLIQHSETTETW